MEFLYESNEGPDDDEDSPDKSKSNADVPFEPANAMSPRTSSSIRRKPTDHLAY